MLQQNAQGGQRQGGPVDRDTRAMWLITAYAASFVGLLGVLVYYWWQLPH